MIRGAVEALIVTCPMDKIIEHPYYTIWALLKQTTMCTGIINGENIEVGREYRPPRPRTQ